MRLVSASVPIEIPTIFISEKHFCTLLCAVDDVDANMASLVDHLNNLTYLTESDSIGLVIDRCA